MRLGLKISILSILLLLFIDMIPMYAQNEKALGLKTVVIDPGHGGKDPGALGKTSSTSEKHLVLKISKLLGKKINAEYPDIKVIYTRSTDVFVELKERVNVAKRNNADLFISMHCNSNNSAKPYGASVHILGPKSKDTDNKKDYFAASMSVAQRENSVMLLEDDYKTKYQDFDPDSPESIISHSLMWNANYSNSLLFAAEVDKVMKQSPFRVSSYSGIHQDIFYLLWATNMPAALLELGFISNNIDFNSLSSADGQEKIAQKLFDAFKAYKMQYDLSLGVGQESSGPKTVQKTREDKTSETAKPAPDKDSIWYGVQIMGLGRALKEGDPALKGLSVEIIKDKNSNIYKYVTACSPTRSEAVRQLGSVRRKFPDAFLVEVSGDTVKRSK